MFSTLLNVDASSRTVFFLIKTYMISENPDRNSSQVQPRDSDVNEKLLIPLSEDFPFPQVGGHFVRER